MGMLGKAPNVMVRCMVAGYIGRETLKGERILETALTNDAVGHLEYLTGL